MVRVEVGQQHGVQGGPSRSGAHELLGHARAAVHKHLQAVVADEVGRAAPVRVHLRAAGAEEDQFHRRDEAAGATAPDQDPGVPRRVLQGSTTPARAPTEGGARVLDRPPPAIAQARRVLRLGLLPPPLLCLHRRSPLIPDGGPGR